MKDGKKYTFYFVIFLAVLLVPFAGMLITGPSKSESSSAARLPALVMVSEDENKTTLNKDYLKQLGEYFEGHCALRQEMVTGYSLVTAKVFRTSSSKSVIYGKNGWMFYTDTLGDYTGTEVMSERELNDCVRTLKLIDSYCKANGLEFVFVIAANKNSLYGENMPYYYAKTTKPGNRVRLVERLKEEGIRYVDLYDVFAAENKVLYHKTDSHWNNEGAALAARAIHEATGQMYVERYNKAPYKVQKDFKGDLAAMMYPSSVPLEEEIYYDGGFGFDYEGKVESNFDNKIMTLGALGNNLMMYRDSFGSSLLPFMAESYKNALFSRSLTVQVRDIRSIKANVLIIEKAERFLPQLSANPPKLPATEIECDPVGVKELEGAADSIRTSSANGYTTITGTLKEGTYSDNTRIYVSVGGHWYEAYPFRDNGKECFQLYVEDFAEGTEIKVVGSF
ncbi:MAG: hypothetical protein Q3987_05960 [Oscillospiraceae bacterium]|nr:hypothetical protein [Oscillospiraceae bacterium]